MKPATFRVAVAVLLAAFAAQCFFLIFQKSPTTDEISFHAVNGYAYLKTRDFRMSPATPPFCREWVALPWLAMRPTLHLGRAWQEADSVPFAVKFFYGVNRSRANDLLWAARFFAWLLAVGMGWIVCVWARALYGERAALLALGLFAFAPVIVAHAPLAAADVGPAFFYFLTMYLLWDHERRGLSRFPWGASAALGLALASKYTAVLLLPVILFALWTRFGARRALATLLGMLAAAFLVVWACYFFEFKPLLANVPRVDEKIEMIRGIAGHLTGSNPALKEAAVKAALHLQIPLSSWILGFAGIARSHQDEYLHFFGGQWTNACIWYHYLVSFVLKTPLAFLVLLGWRAVAGLAAGRPRRGEWVYLLPPVLILFGVTFFDTTGVGIRYLVPVFPFLFVWVSGLARSSRRVVRIAIFLVAAHAVSALSQFPNSLSYFNVLAGGPQGGWRWLRGSDHDWGGELGELKKYLSREKIESLRTDLFGTRDESFYGLPSEPVGPEDFKAPSPTVYAVSVNHLDHFRWIGTMPPTARVGNAIFIYDLRTPSSKANPAVNASGPGGTQ